jgi:hypothetical protein
MDCHMRQSVRSTCSRCWWRGSRLQRCCMWTVSLVGDFASQWKWWSADERVESCSLVSVLDTWTVDTFGGNTSGSVFEHWAISIVSLDIAEGFISNHDADLQRRCGDKQMRLASCILATCFGLDHLIAVSTMVILFWDSPLELFEPLRLSYVVMALMLSRLSLGCIYSDKKIEKWKYSSFLGENGESILLRLLVDFMEREKALQEFMPHLHLSGVYGAGLWKFKGPKVWRSIPASITFRASRAVFHHGKW